MKVEELRGLIEPYLDLHGYEGSMRANSKSYVKQLIDFIHANECEELNDRVISCYIKSKAGTAKIGSRELRCKEFAEYVESKKKGEPQLMIPEMNAVTESIEQDSEEAISSMESEVKEASILASLNRTDIVGTTEAATESEPATSIMEASQIEPETAKESASKKEAEVVKPKGRPKKSETEQRKNNFSVYLTNEIAQGLRDLADYERKDVSVFIGEIIERFIKRNGKALYHYRTFLKERIQLE